MRHIMFAISRAAARVLTIVAAAGILTLATGSARAADLQNVADQLAIQKLWAQYAFALDTADPDAYAILFTTDAKLSIVGPAMAGGGTLEVGRDKIRAFIADLQKGALMKTAVTDSHGRNWGPIRHVTTSLIVNVTGNTATAESYWMEVEAQGVSAKNTGNPLSVRAMGRYEDQLVKQDGKWLFANRVIVNDMFQPAPSLTSETSDSTTKTK